MKRKHLDWLALAIARQVRKHQDDRTIAELMATPEDELRARQKDNHRQNKLIRRAIKAKRRQGET